MTSGHVLNLGRQRDHDQRAQARTEDLSVGDTLVGKQFLEEAFSVEKTGVSRQKKQWQRDLIDAIYQERVSDNGNMIVHHPSSTRQDPLATSLAVIVFLQSLEFEEMASRHVQIEEAYQNTFKWIFEDQTNCPHPWSDFPSWLISDLETGAEPSSNIYWFTGKAGSGKSTMMKYIYHHDSTTQCLQQWAGGKPFTLAAFFFRAAPDTEKSLLNTQEGLLRTLLHQVFRQKPELIELACPHRWDACRLFGFDPHEWTWEELLSTARSVLEHSDDRFVFLIDGLDEFYGDHSELLEFIDILARDHRIKVCVSSRPWLVFENKFGRGPCLTLHHLTAKDIQHFASEKLFLSQGFVELNESKPDVATHLINEIANKSNGVFLWVRIVVRALYEGLLDGDHESQLRERLDGLPAELENLFKNILDNLRPGHKKEASLLFQIVRAARSPLDLLSLSFADNDDPEFAINLKHGVLNENDCLYQCSKMRRRLNSRCRGLLELVDPAHSATRAGSSLSQSWVPDEFVDLEKLQDPQDLQRYINMLSRSRVQYMHRTVKDYVEKPDVWATLLDATPDNFNPHAALCHASLVQLKTQDPMDLNREKLWSKIYQVLYYAALAEHTSQNALVHVLDELDCVGRTYSKALGLLARHIAPHSNARSRAKNTNSHTRPEEPHWTVTQSKGAPEYSFMCLAVQFGLFHYVKAKLEADRKLVHQKSNSRSLLDCAILEHPLLSDFAERPPPETAWNVELVSLLLLAGDNPNRVDYLKSTPWSHVIRRIKKEHRRGDERKLEDRKWKGLPPEQDHMDYWIYVAELFIRNGADCWKRLDTETKNAFRTYDENGEKTLEKILKKERRSWSQIRLAIAGR
jgi:hypothetical protein